MAHRAATKGLEGDTLFSERPGQLGDLARVAADGGAKLLVVVGGDGSVNEVANGIAGRDDVELAVIPRGTGWDFSRTYKIPHKLDGAIDVALTGTTRTIDLGRASYRAWEGGESESHFANVASAGMSGAIAQRANETTKALGGKVSYLWATFAVFAKWQNSELRLTVDGESRVGRMHDVVVANGKTFGGGMIICPDAEPDDGLFDVLTIGDLTKRDLLVTLPKTYRGSHLPHPKAELLRGAVVTVDADGAAPGRARRRAAGDDARAVRDRAESAAAASPDSLGQRRRLRGRRLARGGLLPLRRRLRRRCDLLLELRNALLELVEAAQLLLHLVKPGLRLVHHVDELRAAWHVREPIQRLVAELGEAGDDVILLCRARFWHGAIVPRHARTLTGVPARVPSKSRWSRSLRTRMHPFETAAPIRSGRLVP